MAITIVVGVYFGDNDLVFILVGSIGTIYVPVLSGVGWMYVLREFEDPVKFLGYWCSVVQLVILATNLVRIRSSAWGISGMALIFATTALIAIYLKGYFRSWKGNVVTVILIIFTTVVTFWFILENPDNLNPWMTTSASEFPWMINESTSEGDHPWMIDESTFLSLLGGILTYMGILNVVTSLAPQVFLLGLERKITEYRVMEAVMESIDSEVELSRVRPQRVIKKPEAPVRSVLERIREFVTGPMTLRSLVVTLLLVGVVTIVFVYLNPSQSEFQTEEAQKLGFYEIIERLTWLNYTRFDIDCWYPEGMTLEELSLEGRAFSYYEGGLHGCGDPSESNRAFIHAGEFFLFWKPSGSFDSWTETLDYAIQVTGYGARISYSYDESQLQVLSPMLTWQGHHVAGGNLNGTGRHADRWVGVFDAHECAETGRVIVWIYIDFEKYDPIDYKYNGMVYFATYRCHPIEGTPIDQIIG